MSGLSWPPSGPRTPGDALEASRANTRRLPRPPSLAASHHRGLLTPPLSVATAARGTGAPPGGSRHGRSAPPPWPAYTAPQLGRAGPVCGLGLWQGLAYARVGQAEVIIDLIQGQLLPQPVFALAQRADPSPDRGDMLTDGQVDPLHEGRVDVPPEWGQDVIDGLQGAKHHAVLHVDQAPASHLLDHLRVE